MIYGRQSVKQSVSKSISRPAGLLAAQALLVPFHALAINAGIILIRSILGPRSLGLLLLATDFCSRSETESSSEERGTEVMRGQENEREKLQRSRRRGEGRSELLDRELVACSPKKNWKSVALDRPDDLGRGGSRRGQLWGTVGPSVSFLPPSVPLPPSSLPPVRQKGVADCE